ncbi:unnamed protein product, partial [Mesorhabditis belari]|uniref:Uncharacterized protein n=1 Tax=Mesorhabditis belari TaxID=2138241 RepID=A0AAF3EMX1_9BILA
MIASSIFTITNYVIYDVISLILLAFAGNNILGLVEGSNDLVWALFFHLGASSISCFCFRRRKEKPRNVIVVSQTTQIPLSSR